MGLLKRTVRFYLTFHSSDFSLYFTLSMLEVSPRVPSVFCMTLASRYQGSFPQRLEVFLSDLVSRLSSSFSITFCPFPALSSHRSRFSFLSCFILLFLSRIRGATWKCVSLLATTQQMALAILEKYEEDLFFFFSRSTFSKRVSGLTLPSVFALLCLLYWASSGVDLLQGFPGIWCYKWKTSCG